MIRLASILLGFLFLAYPLHGDIRSIQLLGIHAGGEDGSCTTFSINRHEGYWMTAGHCTWEHEGHIPTYTIAGFPATLILVNADMDLALLAGPQAGSLWLRKEPPQTNDILLWSGYLGGNTFLLTMEGKVDHPYYVHPPGMLWARNLLFDTVLTTPLGGMSGSPIFIDGEVVSVDQGLWIPGDDYSHIVHTGATWQDLVDFTKGYWQPAH